ncbi:unnamed protein product [Cladocopium goreaui]|uniref:Cyclin-Q (Cyclin-related protein FAM58A) n=1 Tax=Cladocopium goreaui TaxID=2562237 RepID=A0A9P1DIT3_9DINO|nr:unnamed protein product [Cladocopium goreaui]
MLSSSFPLNESNETSQHVGAVSKPMPLEKERSWGRLIWAVAADLALDTVTAASGCFFFQRFCLAERTEGDFDHHRLAMASLWLATKVRETSCRLRDIVNGFEVLLQRAESCGMPMEVYWAMRDEIVVHEQVLLRGLGFDVELTSAYAYLCEFSWMLGSSESQVLRLAWTLLNDAFRCEICAMASSDRLALGCLLLALELSRRVPSLQLEAAQLSSRLERLLREPQLEEFLGLGAGGEEIEDICRDLLAMYEDVADKEGRTNCSASGTELMQRLLFHWNHDVANQGWMGCVDARQFGQREAGHALHGATSCLLGYLGPEVSEAGCLLIGHLCSCTATKTGDLMPVRVKAHRDSQNNLCREGAVEIIVDVMTLYMKEVRSMTNKAHMLMQEKMKEAEGQRQKQDEVEMGLARPDRVAVNVFGKIGGGLKDRILKVQANIELRQAWQKVLDREVSVGRLLNAALQALLLLVVGNLNAIRQLSGNFYTYHLNKLLDLQEEFIDAAADAVKETKDRKDARRGVLRDESDGEDAPDKGLRIRGKVGRVEVPEGQERRSMLSVESLSLKCQVLVDALRGHAAKDRPKIVCKACRLFLLILEHHKGLICKANDQGKNQCRRVELQLRKAVPDDDLKFRDVFRPLESIVAAFIGVLKTHNENSPVISVVFSVLAKLRELALLSVPAGMHLNGSNAQQQWQALLFEAGGPETELVIRQASKRLHLALEETKKGDHRIETFKIDPSEIKGNGEWLTPRMREEVQEMIQIGEVLAADAFKANWEKKEEPERWERIYQKQQQLLAQAKYREDKKKAKEMGITYEEFHQRELEEQARKDAEEETSSSGVSSFDREERPKPGQPVEEEEEEQLNFDEEDVFGEAQWLRAIGFGSHDEEDFDRLWRGPITDVLMRNLPAPAPPDSKWAIEAAQRRREIIEQAEKSGEPLEDPDMDELLQIEMLESVQGKLKIRALVRPQDQIQANNIESRGKELTDPKGASTELVKEVAKSFRRSGYLMPKYGLAVRIQKRAASMTQLAQEAQKAT